MLGRMSGPTITLLTDFGTRDGYVGAVRGVLATLCPAARLADISHDVAAHDLLGGAFVLAAASRWYPDGTVHLAVVDPGVGGPRRGVVAVTDRFVFVAPDNGLLTLVLDQAPGAEVREIERLDLGLDRIHPTFHGRDLFAPLAARIAEGLDPRAVGGPVAEPVRLALERPRRDDDGGLQAAVLHVDRFGNITTNVDLDAFTGLLGPVEQCQLALDEGATPLPFVATYCEGPAGAPFLLWGSSGYLEIAVDRARADEIVPVRPGDPIRFAVRAAP
jgi:hypothetical protein